MRTVRRSLLIPALLLGAALFTGCASGGATPSGEPTRPSTPANTVDHAIVLGEGDVDVQLWTDASCPYCALLDELVGEDFAGWIDAGEITWTIHPMTYVSAKHGDTTEYSTRAANLLAAVANAGEVDRIPAVSALLLQHQPHDTDPPTDDDLLEIARTAGVAADLTDAVREQWFSAWAQDANDQWTGAELPGTGVTLAYVPSLVVDGVFIELAGDATDRETVRNVIQAAIDG